jgi:hypothetical protein
LLYPVETDVLRLPADEYSEFILFSSFQLINYIEYRVKKINHSEDLPVKAAALLFRAHNIWWYVHPSLYNRMYTFPLWRWRFGE